MKKIVERIVVVHFPMKFWIYKGAPDLGEAHFCPNGDTDWLCGNGQVS